jgi:hypothetical protein|tara:strand:+ start:3678 stop:3842 length:165 start_codon:yes stop_codon:yes gene_type:complete
MARKETFYIDCPLCQYQTEIEVLNGDADAEPEACPMCGSPVDLHNGIADEEYEE